MRTLRTWEVAEILGVVGRTERVRRRGQGCGSSPILDRRSPLELEAGIKLNGRRHGDSSEAFCGRWLRSQVTRAPGTTRAKGTPPLAASL